MICPKCGRPVDEAAVICTGCDFILDTEFLGEGILDEEHSLRPGAGGVDPAAFNLADAVILGNIDEVSQSFETSDSGFHIRDRTGARLYVSGRSQAMMAPDAIPAINGEVDDLRLTPFEKHVLTFIDGTRPVEVIRKQAGLDEAEVKTALATLADKGVIRVVGRALVDFDPRVETAPRRPARRGVRGSVVGAVAIVGDETDRAIEEAFRTQVRAAVVSVDPDDVSLPSLPARADDDPSLPGLSELPSRADDESASDDLLPSDADSFAEIPGTREIQRRDVSGQHPAAPRGGPAAVNRAPTATRQPTARRLPLSSGDGDVPPAGRFEEFSDASGTGNRGFIPASSDDISETSTPALEPVRGRNYGPVGELAAKPPEPVSSDPSVPSLKQRTLRALADSRAVGDAADDLGFLLEPDDAYTPAVTRGGTRGGVPSRNDPSLSLSQLLSDDPPASPDEGGIDDQLSVDDASDVSAKALLAKRGGSPPKRRTSRDPLTEGHDEDAHASPPLVPSEYEPSNVRAPNPRAAELDSFETSFNSQERATERATPKSIGRRAVDDDVDEPSFDAEDIPPRVQANEIYDDETAAPARGPMRPTGPSSAEVIDDRMIIRPAAKALPLSTALRVARGRGSRPGDNPLEGTASLSPRPMPQVPPAPLSDSNGDAPRSGGRVSDGQRSKARDLFELAMRDREAGRSSSAKMNARLATIYDPENEQYRRALAEWEEPGGSSSTMQAAPVSPSQASQVSAVAKRPDYVLLYEEAQTCEEQGDIDRALELLRQGIEQFPSAAAFHNRLGVLLAMKKRDFDAAADAIQRAIELEPENLHYKSNFGKIIQRARQRPRSEPAIRVRAQEP